jgi:hypothetical protein
MSDIFSGLFTHRLDGSLARHPQPRQTLRDPDTGRDLRIATVEVAGAICPSCTRHAQAGFVSFVADLRMVFACPHCRQLVWLTGA